MCAVWIREQKGKSLVAVGNGAGGVGETLVGDREVVGHTGRFGGDEFLVMSFFGSEEEAAEYKEKLTESFREYNEKEKLPYLLKTSIGFSRWQPGQSLAELTELADYATEMRKEKHPFDRGITARFGVEY